MRSWLARAAAVACLVTTGIAVIIAVVLHAAAGIPVHESGWQCHPNARRDPVVLDWTEDIDDQTAAEENFAPPKLEIMADGRVIADAVRVSTLPRRQLAMLLQHLASDLGPHPSALHPLILTRQDGHAEQGHQQIVIWQAGQPRMDASVVYQPASTRPRAPHPFWLAQPLDTGLPQSWRAAVDQLTALHRTVIAHGDPFRSKEIDVVVSSEPEFLQTISQGQVTLRQPKQPWPTGIPQIPPYRPGESSAYAMQHLVLTDAAAQGAARQAFVEYLQWPASTPTYDDGLPGQHAAWSGIWRWLTPTETLPSPVPVSCPELGVTPVPGGRASVDADVRASSDAHTR